MEGWKPEIMEKFPKLCLAIGGSTNAVLHIISNNTIIDLYEAGGVPAIISQLKNHLDLNCMTVDGINLGKFIEGVKVTNREVIRSFDDPLYKEGGIAVLKGNLSPEGCITRQTAIKSEMMVFTLLARRECLIVTRKA